MKSRMKGFAMIQVMVFVVMVGELVKAQECGHGEPKEGTALCWGEVVQDSHGMCGEQQMSLAKFQAVGLCLRAEAKSTAINQCVVMKADIKSLKEDVEATVKSGDIGGVHELSRCLG